jgi:hypothetical protein
MHLDVGAGNRVAGLVVDDLKRDLQVAAADPVYLLHPIASPYEEGSSKAYDKQPLPPAASHHKSSPNRRFAEYR